MTWVKPREGKYLAQWQPELESSHTAILLQNMRSFMQRWVTAAGLRLLSLENFACKIDQQTGRPYGHAGERRQLCVWSNNSVEEKEGADMRDMKTGQLTELGD